MNVKRCGSVSLGIERTVRQIAADNDGALIRMAKQNDRALRTIATKLGKAEQKIAMLEAALGDARADVESLRIENEGLRGELEFSQLETRGAA